MTHISVVLSTGHNCHLSCKHKEREREREGEGRGREAPVWTRRPFLYQGEFHTHMLVAYTGTQGWYSITAHYRLYLALFALPHAYAYEHTRLCANNPRPYEPTTDSMGPVYRWLAKLMPGRYPRQSRD